MDARSRTDIESCGGMPREEGEGAETLGRLPSPDLGRVPKPEMGANARVE